MAERFESIESRSGKISARRAYRLKRCTIFTARLGETKESLRRIPEFHSDPSSVRSKRGVGVGLLYCTANGGRSVISVGMPARALGFPAKRE